MTDQSAGDDLNLILLFDHKFKVLFTDRAAEDIKEIALHITSLLRSII